MLAGLYVPYFDEVLTTRHIEGSDCWTKPLVGNYARIRWLEYTLCIMLALALLNYASKVGIFLYINTWTNVYRFSK